MNTHVHDNLAEIPVCFTTFKKINEAKISVSLHNAGSTSRAPWKTSGPNFSQVQFKSFQTSSFGLPGVFVLRSFGNCAYLCKQIDTFMINLMWYIVLYCDMIYIVFFQIPSPSESWIGNLIMLMFQPFPRRAFRNSCNASRPASAAPS